MFCPQCGTETHEQLRYCKQCGTNLRRVQGVMGKGGAGYMLTNESNLLHEDWLEERRANRENKRNRTPEEKRFLEIKNGVITSCVGLGVTLFLFFMMGAIADLKTIPDDVKWILRAIPSSGLIPFLLGLGMIINGLFVSKKIVQLKREQEEKSGRPLVAQTPETAPVSQIQDGGRIIVSDFSITESTTTKLREPVPISSPGDNI
jgi:Double zinc ribbon